ncbi:putative nucleotidyltransferase, ribonuclease H [Tanacetum coccineum]
MLRIGDLEKQLKETKQTFGKAILTLVDSIKTLEAALKRKTKRVILFDSEEGETEAQGRKTHDLDPLVSLVQELVTPLMAVNASREEQIEDISLTTLEAAAILTKVQKIKSVDKGKRYKRRKSLKVFVGIGLNYEEVKSALEEVKTGGIKVSFGIEEVNAGSLDINTGIDPVTTDSIRVSVPSPNREEARLAEAIRLDALEKSLKKEEVAKQFEAQSYTEEDWDNIRAKIEANAELKESVLGKDLTIKDYAKRMVELKLNFDEVKAEFEKLVNQLDTFVPMNFKATKESLKRFSEELQTKTAKKLKFDDEDHDKDKFEDSDEANEKDYSTSGIEIPINPVPIATKSPSIANYKIIKQGRKGVYQIVRENGTDMVYISFGAMLTDISRDDLTKLYRIVMKKHGMNEPEDEFEKVLWEYLKNMFEEPLSTDSIWSLPGQQRIICWRYYDACRVHCLNLESADIYMLIERKYPLSAEVCKAMLDKKLQGGKPDEDCYKFLKMMEKQAELQLKKNSIKVEEEIIRDLERLDIELCVRGQSGFWASLRVEPNLISQIKTAQKDDGEIWAIIQNIDQQTEFRVDDDGILWQGTKLCVPEDPTLREALMTEAHSSPFSIHPGSTKMYHDLKQHFWWSGMKRDVATFVSKCLTCQQVKIEHQRASGLLQPLEIPVWKWDEISMDFVTGLPRTQRKHDAIWVVVDRLTKSAHFLPIRKDYPVSKLAEMFQQEIVRLHGTPSAIVSDRDPRFTSRFWKGLQKAWGTRLKFSTAFHPETDGQSERTIQTLEDMLRSCALEWAGNWDDYICLVEFAYNNSWHASIKCAPFEMLYGRKCRAPICWDQVGERILEGPEMIGVTNEKVAVAREKLKEAQTRQKSYADRHRRALEFQPGEHVFLKVSPTRGVRRFGINGKLSPRFIGPFEILDRVGEVSYRLALPPQLSHVHNVFHVSLLRGYKYHPLHVISYPFDQIREDLSYTEEPESILDRQDRVMRNKTISFVKILWRNHPEREATWETEESIRTSYPHFLP